MSRFNAYSRRARSVYGGDDDDSVTSMSTGSPREKRGGGLSPMFGSSSGRGQTRNDGSRDGSEDYSSSYSSRDSLRGTPRVSPLSATSVESYGGDFGLRKAPGPNSSKQYLGRPLTNDDLLELEGRTSQNMQGHRPRRVSRRRANRNRFSDLDFIEEQKAQKLEILTQHYYAQMAQEAQWSISNVLKFRPDFGIFKFVSKILGSSYGLIFILVFIMAVTWSSFDFPSLSLRHSNTELHNSSSAYQYIGSFNDHAGSKSNSQPAVETLKMPSMLDYSHNHQQSLRTGQLKFIRHVAHVVTGRNTDSINELPTENGQQAVQDYAKHSNGAKLIYKGKHKKGYCPTVTNDTFLGLKIWDLYPDKDVRIACNPPSVILDDVSDRKNYWLYKGASVSFSIQPKSPVMLQSFSLLNVADDLTALNPTSFSLWGKFGGKWTRELSKELNTFVPQPKSLPKEVPHGYIHLMDMSVSPYASSYSEDFPEEISGIPISEIFIQVRGDSKSMDFGRLYRIEIYGSDYSEWISGQLNRSTTNSKTSGWFVSRANNNEEASELGSDEEL